MFIDVKFVSIFEKEIDEKEEDVQIVAYISKKECERLIGEYKKGNKDIDYDRGSGIYIE